MAQSNEEILFSGLLKPTPVSGEYRTTFFGTFPDGGIFKNEWYVLYNILKAFIRVDVSGEFVQIYLAQHRAEVSRDSHIDLSAFAMGDTDPYLAFAETCINTTKTCARTAISDSKFSVALESFRMSYVSQESIELLEQGAEIISSGLEVGRRTLAGFGDMTTYVINGLSKLNNIVNKTNRRGITVYGMNDDTEESVPLQRVATYGIESLDKALGGIYETDMISVLAPPKGGKSRIAAFFIHNALVNGTNCVTWSLENGDKGIEALIRACHFNWMYNSTEADITKRHLIDSDMIRKNELKGDLKQLESASWLDLRTNKKYGRWANIDEDFEADTFLTILDNAVTTVNAKLVLVDYLQLLTGDGKLSKNERIGQCYQRSLQYLMSKKIAGIFPAQFKQLTVGDLSKKSSDELAAVELRDGGGETSEVIRTPSVLFAIYADTIGLRNGELKLLSIPSRNAASFAPIDLYADFGVCNFIDMSGGAS